MEELKKSPYANYVVHKSVKILEQIWTDESESMSENDYKKEMKHFRSLVRANKIRNAIFNVVNFNFKANTEIEQWVDTEIGAKLSKNINCVCFVLNRKDYQAITPERIHEDCETSPYDIVRYFDNKDAAFVYLLPN